MGVDGALWQGGALWRLALWGEAGSGAARITHERQVVQTREAREGSVGDASDLVVVLLEDRENERREAGIDRSLWQCRA